MFLRSPLGLGLVGVWLFALVTRFWGLTRFNTLVFDEIYFARFGRNYLAGLPFFDAHPPLGKYLIALGIYLSGHFDPWGYRWLNAFTGALIPLLVAGLAACLWRKPLFIFLAAFLTSLDGLLLVESRYALINMYLLFFGLVGQILWLWACGQRGRQRWIGLVGAGLALGCCVAVKWSGLGYVLGLYGVWGIAKICGWVWGYGQRWGQHLQAWGNWSFWQMGLVFPISMAGIYSLLWWPHLRLNPGVGFFQIQQQLYNYHKSISSTAHPYCSAWFTWPLGLRPMSYFYLTVDQLTPNLGNPPLFGPMSPRNATAWVYDVHAQFNPVLLWLSTLSVLILLLGLGVWIWERWQWDQTRPIQFSGSAQHQVTRQLTPAVALFVVMNYGANLLPWVQVGRCLFIYHYLPAAIFSFLGLAALLTQAGIQSDIRWRGVAVLAIALVIGGFIFWLPIFLGLPLTPLEFSWRMWFRSWI
ncbi:phospholipid carrier-dependent glycosyltransferase [Pseudocalidococcus azoricus]|nr:phospholipid carrier-dependent glycosyltransferase [Pseudocalidococcus azoricus]